MSVLKEKRLLKAIRKERKSTKPPVLEFSGKKPRIRSLLFCLPENAHEFRIARYIFFPVFEKYNVLQVKLLCPLAYKELLPRINPIRTVIYSDEDFNDDLIPQKRIFSSLGYPPPPDAIIDLNISPSLRIQSLVLKTDASLRIGFHSSDSHLFYNVEIELCEDSFIESGYRNIRRFLNL